MHQLLVNKDMLISYLCSLLSLAIMYKWSSIVSLDIPYCSRKLSSTKTISRITALYHGQHLYYHETRLNNTFIGPTVLIMILLFASITHNTISPWWSPMVITYIQSNSACWCHHSCPVPQKGTDDIIFTACKLHNWFLVALPPGRASINTSHQHAKLGQPSSF